MKPAFSYYGGKQKMSKRIVSMIPKHTCYVEPFSGGAAVYFAKPVPQVTNGDNYREVLNDTDGRIVNFYRVLKEHPDELLAALDRTLYSRADYEESLDNAGSDVERAKRWFVNIQQSFANKSAGGWSTGKQVSSRNHPKTFAQKVDALRACADRLRHTYIECDDALAVIKRFDGPGTFFYVDPPYVGADQGHYGGYTQTDLDALVTTLDACEGAFLLSGYDNNAYPAHWGRWDVAGSAGSAVGVNGSGNSRRVEVLTGRERRLDLSAASARVLASSAFSVFSAKLGGGCDE